VTYAIRRTADVDLLTALHLEIFPHDHIPAFNVGWWWIVDSSGPVGFAGLHPSKRWRDAGYMIRAGVLDEHCGKGLQKRLIRARIAQARRVGFRWLITNTHDNPASCNALIGCGFRIYEPAEPWAAKGALYWRRAVNG
jgi:GNAT superfamily N-acetyltransferase